MKRAIHSAAAIAAVAAVSQAALAADMPVRRPLPQQPAAVAPAPLFNWSGFYVGAHGGYGWGSSQYDASSDGAGFDANGWLAGALAGVNYQVGQAVFGLEGDINWANFEGSATCGGAICGTEVPWYGTLRGRLGYAADRFMPYVTGGLAFGKVNATVPGVGSQSETQLGWTAGAGVEYAVTNNISWKTEYLYMDLGGFNCSSCGGPTPEVEFKSHTVRSGINVRF
jgi:outer membrane immunogenic protein